MAAEPGSVVLAGVAHISHSAATDWLGTVLMLVGFFAGIPLIVAGVAFTRALLGVKDRKTWFNYAFGPAVLLVGLTLTVCCLGRAFRLL
ncbi:hypothetical protein ACIQU6_28405 [Streptomyces sp. NPDC090442]|uniref:hypothetical protein n=1 Tax=Streptomyces sp. NPDC090442 TaxID=3365962 RepID=UPI0037FCF078